MRTFTDEELAERDEATRADERAKLRSFHAAWKAQVRHEALEEAASMARFLIPNNDRYDEGVRALAKCIRALSPHPAPAAPVTLTSPPMTYADVRRVVRNAVAPAACAGCDFPNGAHRFSCMVGGVRAGQVVLPATVSRDGAVTVAAPTLAPAAPGWVARTEHHPECNALRPVLTGPCDCGYAPTVAPAAGEAKRCETCHRDADHIGGRFGPPCPQCAPEKGGAR